MDNINNLIIKDCIDVGFTVENIKSKTIDDKSDSGSKYRKTISYMDNTTRISKNLVLLIHDKSKSVARIVDYIINNLGYNETNIILRPSIIANIYKDDIANISRGIKELTKLDIIRKISDIIPNDILPKNTYAVNFNYICNGNIHEIKQELLKQRNKINKQNGKT